MGKSEMLISVASWPEGDPRLVRLAALCAGTVEAVPAGSLRLLRPSQAARESGLSRYTLLRLRKEGVLKAVEVRRGHFRFPESELRNLAEGRK